MVNDSIENDFLKKRGWLKRPASFDNMQEFIADTLPLRTRFLVIVKFPMKNHIDNWR